MELRYPILFALVAVAEGGEVPAASTCLLALQKCSTLYLCAWRTFSWLEQRESSEGNGSLRSKGGKLKMIQQS